MARWGWGGVFVSGRRLVDKVLLRAKGQCLWISAAPRSTLSLRMRFLPAPVVRSLVPVS